MFQRLLRLAVPAVFAGLVSVSATLAADGTDVPIPRIAPHAAATIPSLPDDALPFTTTAQAEPTLRPTSDGTDDDALGSGDGVIIDPTAEGGLAPDVGPPSEIRPGTFTLEARMTPDGGPLGERDPAAGRVWLERAAAQGVAEAADELADSEPGSADRQEKQ